jgi:hypothetical protein
MDGRNDRLRRTGADRLPNGEPFYFRARGEDPSDSYLPADDTEDILRRLATSFVAGDPAEGVAPHRAA